ncbi:hypothetical protein METHB2_430017 [Candidatus Methylobacter favarea]|uniref:EAL domain-containing protein n=2 Tax=Candidatus Methylobacter favarea TaxID=2707345 RepID=A0A8S0WJU6_9GAMM|nr:hypothetical protein METHB2_430017 [Candidatus Methylobacter favarea]
MQDDESTDSVLQGLAELGVKLAINDYGTGYSSLNYLRQLLIDTLKIDQSFVKRISSNANRATLVSVMITVAKCLKL